MKGSRILHASSNTLDKLGLRVLLDHHEGLEKILEVSNEEQLWASLNSNKVDLIILDLSVPEVFSMKTILTLRKKMPELNQLIIAPEPEESLVRKVLGIGVSGFLTSECDEEEIRDAVAGVLKGGRFYCQKVLDSMVSDLVSDDYEPTCEGTELSERELEILSWVARGHTNKEIGKALNLSHHTVATHRKNIFRKLGLSSVPDLVRYAVSLGLV